MLFGTVTVFVAVLNSLGVGFLTQLAMRLILTLPFVFLASVMMNGAGSLVIRRRDVPVFLVGGLLILLLFSTYIAAVVIGTPIVTVVFLSNTSVIWSLLLGRIVLKEEVTGRKVWSLLGMVAGVLLLSALWTTRFTISAGEGLALVNGFLFAPYLILIRKKTKDYEPLTLTTGFFAVALLLLMACLPILNSLCGCGGVTFSLDDTQLLLMLGLALVGTVMPSIWLYVGLKHIQASVGGMLNLATPVVATILSAVVLGQIVEVNQVIGGVLIMLSIVNLYR
jgi:drug/metabolite transporter (DMT)-like permease